MRLMIVGLAAALTLVETAYATQEAKPKLVIQITLDQLRSDALQHYRGAFTGGLDRILSEGYWYTDGIVDHGLTVSYPGHASLSTGAHPSRHGMTANEWWLERDGRWTWVDAADDLAEHIVGFPNRRGPSPRNLLVPTLGEQVKAADPAAKSISLSTGNFIAVVYGGHSSDGVYWFDAESGKFVTSTYYRQTLPDWVVAFNEKELPPFRSSDWESLLDAGALKLANPDASPIENEGVNAVFPHRFDAERSKDAVDDASARNQWFAGTPMKDEALAEFAQRAIEAEKLGEDDVADYLSVAFDSTDSIGHRFGWRSVEYLDALKRIDRSLGELLDYVDRKVGKDAYVLALSADHGVADFPETAGRRRVTTAEIEAALDRVESIASANTGSTAALAEEIARELESFDFIAAAYTEAELTGVPADSYAALYRRSFRPDATPDFPLWTEKESRPYHPARYGVIVRFVEGATFDAAPAVHGSPYDYDRKVPIVFYGASIKRRRSKEEIATVDLAPTLAELAGLTPPEFVDGESAAESIAVRRRRD